MNYGKSIRIYLKDGTVSGIREGEIMNLSILSVVCPRNMIEKLKNYSESGKEGIYFLFGSDDKTGGKKVYIGEGVVMDRIKNHEAKKDFWNEVILFISKDENLTKAHVKYLESKAIKVGKKTDRYLIDNINASGSNLPDADKDTMDEFFEYMKLLLGLWGHNFLEELTPGKLKIKRDENQQTLNTNNQDEKEIPTQEYLFLKQETKDIKAKAIQTNEGFVVFKDSEAAKDAQPSIPTGYKELRNRLIENGTLELKNDKYIFKKDYLFNTSSPAAAVILGRNAAGPKEWKDNFGKTLNDLEQQKLK